MFCQSILFSFFKHPYGRQWFFPHNSFIDTNTASNIDEITSTHFFYKSIIFISNTRLKLAKNKANTKNTPRPNFCCLKIIHIFYKHYSKIMRYILKNKEKNKCVCIYDSTQLIIMKMKMEIKNRSHWCNISRSR